MSTIFSFFRESLTVSAAAAANLALQLCRPYVAVGHKRRDAAESKPSARSHAGSAATTRPNDAGVHYGPHR